MSSSVLVVDDDASSRRILKLGLERAGYEVATAEDGVEALDMLRAARFDALITDINMPRMDGLELCRTIRGEPLDHEPVIFVLTARTGGAHRDSTAEIGNAELVEKPASLRQLVARLSERLPTPDPTSEGTTSEGPSSQGPTSRERA